MTKFAHLTNSEYRAMQCQVLAAEYAARARRDRDTCWFHDAMEAQMWAEHYARRARLLMNVEEV